MKYVVYIHGASSTYNSFNFINDKLSREREDYCPLFFEYDCSRDLQDITNDLLAYLPDGNDEIILVGHSLGGVIATAVTYNNESISPKKNIKKVVTISSPLAGSKAATYLRWLYPNYGLFNNVAVTNPIIMAIQSIGAIVPTQCIISNGGTTPLIKEANDGVVSVASQGSLKHCKEHVNIKLNHFEVLLSSFVVQQIERFIWDEKLKDGS